MRIDVKKSMMIVGSLLLAAACSKDDGNPEPAGESYNTTFRITDAPIDNAAVKAVYVTVTDVRVNGTSLEGFSKTTINLAALVNGQTQTLGNMDLQAGSYSDIVLELDYDTDVAGNSPGCYVELADGVKDKLEAAAAEVSVNHGYEILAGASNEVIIDFDLRKTIREEQGTVSSDFEFVSMSELSAGIRTVNEEVSGEISGTASDSVNTSDAIVVYAYEKGTFNAETETNGQGESNVTFAHAVTSSEVDATTGAYSLNFLKEGEYELVFVSYARDGDAFYFNSLLKAESTTGLDLGAIAVSSSLKISAHVMITGTK